MRFTMFSCFERVHGAIFRKWTVLTLRYDALCSVKTSRQVMQQGCGAGMDFQ